MLLKNRGFAQHRQNLVVRTCPAQSSGRCLLVAFSTKKNIAMEMGTIITGAIVILLCILPFVLLGSGRRKRQKQLQQTLQAQAAQQGGKITRHDCLRDAAIGIDDEARTLFYVKNETTQHIRLQEFKTCRVINNTRTVDNNRVVEQLALALTPTGNGRPDIQLEFYNAETDIQLNGELQLLEKWAQIVGAAIK